jgi:hypothetical protein
MSCRREPPAGLGDRRAVPTLVSVQAAQSALVVAGCSKSDSGPCYTASSNRLVALEADQMATEPIVGLDEVHLILDGSIHAATSE